MARISKLKHVAAGVASSFVTRNNDVNGYWALGVLYADLGQDTTSLELCLLKREACPRSAAADSLVVKYFGFLARASARKNIALEELAQATISIRFNVAELQDDAPYLNVGDPFVCTVTLETKDGKRGVAHAVGRCQKHDAARFSRSGR